MPEIVVRDARYSELPEIARLMAAAFWDDNLFGEHIHPHRSQYPDDMYLYWLRRARVNFWDYRYRFLVAVRREASSPTTGREEEDVIVGTALWTRLGDGGRALELWPVDPRNLLRPLSAAAMGVHAYLWPNRAADPTREDAIERAYPCFGPSAWTGDRAESWYLDALAVHPDRQGGGVGRRLVAWGLDRAQRDGVVASVVSAWKMDGFYRACGFDEQHGNATSGEGNPLKGIDGANMFWRWPRKPDE
ncbi:Acyl-CoA N-acyltransferase [Cordyceps fumosorosea ARSEF 2679]|uniref:Acyl-CoA N-acyltransferase n=1 Tax=Cordyceps fumosorosea (strain ARSEF 2679) TaxID=1081104 RepID=A0A167UGM0_CORFA|nr:Acyl-CoA N-acyltransferase [Cordyceps fumosorosea ARSEF 2679]OAA61559.1 Acyl-CoA N-acyltransferase [Cordyceps fumosorosea ARSEF 2679]